MIVFEDGEKHPVKLPDPDVTPTTFKLEYAALEAEGLVHSQL